MAIEFNHSTTPSPAPILIPAPIPISTTLAIPSLLSYIPLANRISSFPLVLPGPTTTGSMLSIDIPLYAHHLCTNSSSPEELHNMTTHLHDPYLTISLNSYLDINSPLWALYQANLQNQCLGNLLTLAATKQSITHCISMIQSIHHQIKENLTIAFAQLGMPKLVTNIDHYLRELGEITVPLRRPIPYLSPSLLPQEAEQALRRTELIYEIST